MSESKYKALFYTAERGNAPVLEFLNALERKAKAKAFALIARLQSDGPNLPRPYADHVRGKIRELRIAYQSNQYRIFYFFFSGNHIILLSAISKKTQQLKDSDIELAEVRMKDWIARNP